MTAISALDYLLSLGAEMRPGRKFSLDAICALLHALGDPHRRFTSVHVAGTNGKGSTCALIESALRAAGRRTGLYTSPHLVRVNERIRIGADDITDEALAAACTPVQDAVECLLAGGQLPNPPAFFEIMTAVGFLALAQAQVEIAVIEVGLGGRLDATNVLSPAVTAITPIGLDHEQYLGTTVAAIAGEKAGILKSGVPAVTAPQLPEALKVLRERAHTVGSELIEVADDEAAPPSALLGRHQRQNAAVAARVCALLGCPPQAVATGFASVRWPGRLEKISDHPPLILDGAHNPMAARALADHLDDQRAAGQPPPILIYGSVRDKAVEEVCEQLFPRAAAVVLTASQNPRALAPAALAAACGAFAARFEITPNYPAALAAARRLSGGRAPIYVTGSLYLIGEARAL